MKLSQIKSGDQLSTRSILTWRVIQTLVWLIGAFILYSLIFKPTLGIHLFWNILIPVAPLLFVVSVGVWRNVCPMASTALFFRHIGLSKRKKLTIPQSGKLKLIAIIALFIIIPLRHAIFNLSGQATAILIIALGVVAITVSFFNEWKSAWCSGLCPVHPVENLYGLRNKIKLPNAHCNQCHKCVTPCPDSTPKNNPLSTTKTAYHRITGILTVGAFPGFVWGWFQVPDYNGITSLSELISIYQPPFIGMLVSSFIFLVLKKVLNKKTITELFAIAAVSFYYWFRIPALFGFGIYPENGMLIDLTKTIPEWTIQVIVRVLVLFFFIWLYVSKQNNNSWAIRPRYADIEK